MTPSREHEGGYTTFYPRCAPAAGSAYLPALSIASVSTRSSMKHIGSGDAPDPPRRIPGAGRRTSLEPRRATSVMPRRKHVAHNLDTTADASGAVTPASARAVPRPNSRTIDHMFALLSRSNPAPTTELHYRTPYELLVAVMLSAQSTDRMVNQISEVLFARAPDPAALAAMPRHELERLIGRLGLYRTKAKHLQETARRLLEDHGGHVPLEREALEALPGVGRKTANVILNTLLGTPVIAVDTHVARVARRLGLAQSHTPRAIERELEEVIPARYRTHAHHWLVLHGRHVCRARSPSCGTCVLRRLCPSARSALRLSDQPA